MTLFNRQNTDGESALIPNFYENEKWVLSSQFIWNGLQILGIIMVAVIGIVATQGLVFDTRNMEQITKHLGIGLALAPILCLMWAKGDLDLSVGAMYALGGYSFVALAPNEGVLGALLLVIVWGALVGSINALIGRSLRIPVAFVSLIIAVGLHAILVSSSEGRTIVLESEVARQAPIGIIYAIIAIAVIGSLFFLNLSKPKVLANKSLLTWAIVFGGTGVVAAISGVMGVQRLSSWSSSLGTGFEFVAILVVVLSGTIFRSGRPNILGSILAVIGITLLENLLLFLDIEYMLKMLIEVILVLMGLLWAWLYNLIVAAIYRSSQAKKSLA